MKHKDPQLPYEVLQTLKDNPGWDEKTVAKKLYRSKTCLKRELAIFNMQFKEIKIMVITNKILSAYRHMSIATKVLNELDTCGIEPESISKFFKHHFKIPSKKIKEEITRVSKYKNRTVLTDTEFSNLVSEITFHLYASNKTLEELIELTGKSRAWVIAALKKIPNAIGGNGAGVMARGYSIPSSDDLQDYIKVHDIWVNNWKASIKANKKTA